MAIRLPSDVTPYKRTEVFDQNTVPIGLRHEHRTKPGVWALIQVLEGRLLYRVPDQQSEQVLVPGLPGLVRPEQFHEIEPIGDVRFFVEFYAAKQTASSPNGNAAYKGRVIRRDRAGVLPIEFSPHATNSLAGESRKAVAATPRAPQGALSAESQDTPSRAESADFDRAIFHIEPVPPFDLELTVWVLRRNPNNAVDRWDGRTYRRIQVAAGTPHEVEVIQVGPSDNPRLRVTIVGPTPESASVEVAANLDRLLGTRCELTAFYRFAAKSAKLLALTKAYRGVKPPRFLSVFESLVNAIACQQVTLTVGILLLNRLSQLYGPGVDPSVSSARAFPRPEDLSIADPQALRDAGFSRQKARAIIDLAQAVVDGGCDLDALAELDDATVVTRLMALRGVGRWTAEYALLRGLGRTQVFPGDDVGARNGLRQWLGLKKSLDYDGVGRALARWQKYKGLIYFHLLLRRVVGDSRSELFERRAGPRNSKAVGKRWGI